jgi:arylsulfatase A-like enzyme
VLWVIWDTVRADRLSLYGHTRPTTPSLDAWARGARVFTDASSTAGYTLPSHASMFTGRLPSEHCVNNRTPRLDDGWTTLAERFRAAGYRTFLFSANPHVSASPDRNLAQGFEVSDHPWNPRWAERAFELVQQKAPPSDHSSELPALLEAAREGRRGLSPWNIKAAGELAELSLVEWLDALPEGARWFAVLNYMEAHRPYIPARRYRESLLSPAQVERSYAVDRAWLPMWEYTFGLREYGAEELELTRATYDATLRELDDLFASLRAALEARGRLADTVVLLTSDHGEHLGEHHMLDHQYSVYEPVLRVPLVLHAPGRVAAGRDASPVVNFDVFPTLLALAGLEGAGDGPAVSLLTPRAERPRLAEEPAPSEEGIARVREAHPAFDPAPFRRRLRALRLGDHKLVSDSDGRRALYDLARDPLELRDLSEREAETAARLGEQLARIAAALPDCADAGQTALPAPDPERRRMLEALGYLSGGEQP